MERIWLLVLLGCALAGMGLDHADSASRAKSQSHRSLPGVASAASLDRIAVAVVAVVYPEEPIVQQIIERFEMRHTALPKRERVALARTIVREARAQQLDPELVIAVIEVESAGYHLAESHVGALGLMQILPSTGKELAGKLGVPWNGPDTLFDPTLNVRLGTAYLRELADRYDGNVRTALAAYNWGPGRIDRRIRSGATVPSEYIHQVMRAADRYAVVDLPTRS